MENEVKPLDSESLGSCPFCNGAGQLRRVKHAHYVHCVRCAACGPSVVCYSRRWTDLEVADRRAADLWHERVRS